ncbi:hypothetical protein GN958_ATG18180 [Phytophthora infestans]|uniref:Uncharacterized protein n=1 Tax=Phytophthora infestans TaxID=4787 RepID=A0A8S9TVD7_PHYIN|nr:hypothetical protein GN958_ATG18180 [Phytophthora infestans]
MANPPVAITRSAALRGNVVRLECTHELPGRVWDEPIYARLHEARHIQPGHRIPFVIDDSSRRPGWVCTNGMTLTNQACHQQWTRKKARPTGLRDRPLLLLFRFVRFRRCFVTDGDGSDPNRFVKASQTIFLVGQVVAYRTCNRLSFVTPSGAALQPTSTYMCVVAVRQPESSTHTHVLLPAQAAWDSLISRHEYVVGWCHGAPSSSHPNRRTARFRSRWTAFVAPSASDSELQRLLRDAFVPRGSDTSVDFGTSAIPLATEFGRVISINPLEYARTYIGPTGSTSRADEDADSDSESATDILATGMSRGRPLSRDLPPIVSLDTPLRLSLSNEEQWISSDTLGIIQQRGAAPADPGLPSVATVAEVPPVTVAAPATTTATPGISETVVATLMSLAQATQQMVATTQQLVREQCELRDQQPAAMRSRSLWRVSLLPVDEGQPLVDTARVATVDVLDNAAVQAHGGETATDQGIGVGAGARLDVTQAAIKAGAEAATTFKRKDGHSENPAALRRLGDRHRVIIVGVHIGNGTASIATAIFNALDIVIAHGGVLDTRTDKCEWIGIISDRSAMSILTRLVSWTYGTQEEVTFSGLTPIPVRSSSTPVIKRDVAHAMKISYITQSQS